MRKLKVDIIQKVEGTLVEDVARASGIQDSQAFKDARLSLSECETELEKLRSLKGDIKPSENMAMTGKHMELKERSVQLKAQKKNEKEFRFVSEEEITELIVSHLRPLQAQVK